VIRHKSPNSTKQSGRSQAVILVGFMGAGKTTIGRELGRLLGWKFVDLDDVIVTNAGKSVVQIFQEEGETSFRQHEKRALADVLGEARGQSTVIALGGGAFVQPDNTDVISRSGIPAVFLDAEIDTLLLRCRAERKVRPLAQNENQFRQLYEERRSAYMKADHRVYTGKKAVREIVQEIISRLGWSDEVSEVPTNH
jgi:shikimate kinase